MSLDEPLWLSGAHTGALTSGTFYGRFCRYLREASLAPAGLHTFRRRAAKLRRDAGASIEEVSACLDHSSLGVTTVYLRRLEGEADRTWPFPRPRELGTPCPGPDRGRPGRRQAP